MGPIDFSPLGKWFQYFFPLVILPFSLFALFNVYSKIANLLSIKRFHFGEDALLDETTQQGAEIADLEKESRMPQEIPAGVHRVKILSSEILRTNVKVDKTELPSSSLPRSSGSTSIEMVPVGGSNNQSHTSTEDRMQYWRDRVSSRVYFFPPLSFSPFFLPFFSYNNNNPSQKEIVGLCLPVCNRTRSNGTSNFFSFLFLRFKKTKAFRLIITVGRG